MSPSRWSVAVVGPGGVGGLLGAVLTRAGHEVTYAARAQTAAVLNETGMSVSSTLFGDFEVPAPAVLRLTNPVDLCIIAVKATNLAQALTNVTVGALGGAVVLPMLNGVDHMTLLRGQFPAAAVVAGAIRVESTRVAAGRIVQTSPFCWIEVASDLAPELAEQVAEQLRPAGFQVTVRDSETALLWDKVAILAPLAILTAHAGAPAGLVREQRPAEMEQVVAEIAAVAKAAGAEVEPSAVLAMFNAVPADFTSSMQRDAEANRPMELDAIGGCVLRAAERYGIATPVTARLVGELAAREGNSSPG